MEGVVVSRQICLAASAVRQRLVLMTICKIGINRCRPRSTTSKPAMASEPVLFQHLDHVLKLLINNNSAP
ncbi:hypothetical protein [Lapidilactobacillus wuchangensis]|uniref:hypothetical protein n=1 Tax=Lapidilactobacillus wuchangensis TaxID=2486001 RepID=UPI0013DE5F36|nr:hypothetical protein [Lapidilactobacillus wuchangensis]